LGGYSDEEAAAEAYDLAALKVKGPNVHTNFDKERYTGGHPRHAVGATPLFIPVI
jgi:hypothetical protein